MPSSLDQNFIAGYHDLYIMDRDSDFSSSYPATADYALGSTGPEGINLMTTREFEEIKGDALAETTVDMIYKGGNCFLEFVLQEINTDGVRALLASLRDTATLVTNTPYHNEVGPVGHTASTFATALWALPRTDTPADLANLGTGNNGRVFIVVPIGDYREYLDTRQNIIPVRCQCLPFIVAGGSGPEKVWWDYDTPSLP